MGDVDAVGQGSQVDLNSQLPFSGQVISYKCAAVSIVIVLAGPKLGEENVLNVCESDPHFCQSNLKPCD